VPGPLPNRIRADDHVILGDLKADMNRFSHYSTSSTIWALRQRTTTRCRPSHQSISRGVPGDGHIRKAGRSVTAFFQKKVGQGAAGVCVRNAGARFYNRTRFPKQVEVSIQPDRQTTPPRMLSRLASARPRPRRRMDRIPGALSEQDARSLRSRAVAQKAFAVAVSKDSGTGFRLAAAFDFVVAVPKGTPKFSGQSATHGSFTCTIMPTRHRLFQVLRGGFCADAGDLLNFAHSCGE